MIKNKIALSCKVCSNSENDFTGLKAFFCVFPLIFQCFSTCQNPAYSDTLLKIYAISKVFLVRSLPGHLSHTLF